MKDKSTKDIPEELIRAKAYEIWKEHQGNESNPEEDWYAAMNYIEEHRLIVLLWKVNSPVRSTRKLWRKFWSFIADSNSRDFAYFVLEIVKSLGIGLTVIALILTYWNAKEDRKLTENNAEKDRKLTEKKAQQDERLIEERLVTERFSKAVEQLEKEKDTTVRVGGIYALERIAKDSDKDHWTIMEVLTSYIRENSPLPEQEEEAKPVSIDVQAALTVIGRRHSHVTQKHLEELEKGKIINLTNTYLAGANLAGVYLAGADLAGADLKEAILAGADLAGADLAGADLKEAILSKAKLAGADLAGADLEEANLLLAQLPQAKLARANLALANLTEADLAAADLFCANLKADNLPIEIVKSAYRWKKAIYSDKDRQQLGLPPASQDDSCQTN